MNANFRNPFSIGGGMSYDCIEERDVHGINVKLCRSINRNPGGELKHALIIDGAALLWCRSERDMFTTAAWFEELVAWQRYQATQKDKS